VNCVVCDAELARWELPQEMTVLGERVFPKPICSPCAREHAYPPGTREALERLIAGKVDPDAADELREMTLLAWETP
jgi:hypothetical protein